VSSQVVLDGPGRPLRRRRHDLNHSDGAVAFR
jgi:hypothetical protein